MIEIAKSFAIAVIALAAIYGILTATSVDMIGGITVVGIMTSIFVKIF